MNSEFDLRENRIPVVPGIDSDVRCEERKQELIALKVLKAFGIESLASSLGVAPYELTICAAAVINGVAGPDRLLQVPWGWQPATSTDLIVKAESRAMARLLGCLVSPAEMLQKRLVQNMAVFRPRVVDMLTRGIDVDVSDSRGWGSAPATATLDLHAKALLFPGGDQCGPLRNDLRHDPILQRREALLHPRFLLRDRPGKGFPRAVTDCHRKHALLVLDRSSVDRRDEGNHMHQELDRIVRLADVSSADSNSRGIDGPPTVRAILALDEAARMNAAVSGMFRRFLWLGGGRLRETSAKSGASARFYAAYQDVITLMEETRKSGDNSVIQFTSEESCIEFHEQLQSYERRCDAFPLDAGEAALGLPALLFHFFSLLRNTGEFGKFPDSHLISAAFGISRRMSRNHSDAVMTDIFKERIHEGLLLAVEVVDRISEATGAGKALKFRDICRRFKRQKKERFEPVLDTLLELGVINRSDEGTYIPGDVSINDVEGEIREKLSEKIRSSGSLLSVDFSG